MVEGARSAYPQIEYERPMEHEPGSERLVIPRFDVMTISGPRGTFKTEVAKILAGQAVDLRNIGAQGRFMIDGIDLEPIGNAVRKESEARTGVAFIESHEVSTEDDDRIDYGMMQLMRDVRKPIPVVENDEVMPYFKNPLIIEGRFAGFLGAAVDEELTGKYKPIIERVLLYNSNPDEPQAIEVRREKGKGSPLSETKLKKQGLERELKLSKKGQDRFPDLVLGQYIYDPKMVTPQGDPVYTIAIDVRGKLPGEIAEELFAHLRKRNRVWELNRYEFPDTTEGGKAFRILSELHRCEGLMAGNPCNRYAVSTLDVYLGTKLIRQLPTCSKDHSDKLKKREKLSTEDWLTFSKNGNPIDQARSLA